MRGLNAPTRRELLLASGVLFAWAYLPKAALAEGRDPRLIAIILRGALDGLAAVAPVGDPNWISLRGDAALLSDGPNPLLPLDGFFGLNPAMPNVHRLYRAGQATIVHAAATPYRERSHFDGQDVLESGYAKPGFVQSGWLNRALSTLAPADRISGESRSAFAVGPTPPLVVRGSAAITSWAPATTLPAANDDTLERLLDLYRHTDPTFAEALEQRLGLAAIVGAEPMDFANENVAPSGRAVRVRAHFAESAAAAGKVLARPGGPRIGAISFSGWDTHVNEGSRDGRLATLLAGLDGAIGALEKEMGSTWRETVVAVVTEFGRTARINGSAGTDHGTGTIALLAGGALKGGRVIADWPGLGAAQLHEGRDLKPTLDVRAVFKGLLRDHLRVPEPALATTVFPESGGVKTMPGLIV